LNTVDLSSVEEFGNSFDKYRDPDYTRLRETKEKASVKSEHES